MPVEAQQAVKRGCNRSARRLLNPENPTTKSPRHEEIKSQFSFFFVSLCLGGSFHIPSVQRLQKDVIPFSCLPTRVCGLAVSRNIPTWPR